MHNNTIFSKLFFIFFLFASQSVFAQSFSVVNSVTAKLNYSKVSDNYNIAIVGGLEHYKSTDQGNTWVEMNNDPGSELYQLEGFGIAICSASIYCMTGKRAATNENVVLRTTDGGNTWNEVLSSNWPILKDIEIKGNTLIACSSTGIYRSTDQGLNWSFIQLSSFMETSPFVRYNEISSSWVIGGYSSDLLFSVDNGLTWQESALGFAPTSILAATSNTNGLILAKSDASGTQMVRLNAANTSDTAVTVPAGLVVSGNPCKSAAFLANNKLLTHSSNIFYLVDTSNQQVYHFNYPGQTVYNLKSFTVGSSYGVALSSNTAGTQHRLYRIDLTTLSAVLVPSYFSVAGPGPCAGDNIVATANANYADSLKWYVNNVLISTGNQLNYPTPASTYTTYNVKLNTYYQGFTHTTTTPIVMLAPAAPPAFSYTVDTTACYGLPLLVHLGAYSAPNTALKILYNGALVYGPVTMNGTQTNAYIQNLTISGDLQIIMYKTLPCDQSTYSVTKHITVGPDLYAFTTLPNDSVVCVNTEFEFVANGTVSQYNYDFYNTYSFGPWTSNHTIVPGNSTGSLSITQVADNWNNDVTPETYGSMYMYLHLKIVDTAGCAPDKIIDTIRIQRSTAYFELHSRSFLQSDTVHLSNAYVTPNRLWSSEELNPVYISNTTDTIPLVIADTTGFFGITLRNEPIADCADSMTSYIHYTTQAPEMDPICEAKKMHETDYLHLIEMDQFGNLYQVRVYAASVYHSPMYILRKYDAFGGLIWEKEALYSNDVSGVVIEALDFDDEGNPVIGLWAQGVYGYQNNYINLPASGTSTYSECYVLKIDKITGEYIWRTNLSTVSGLPTGSRITDLVVDHGNIYASTYGYNSIYFYRLKSSNGFVMYEDEWYASVPGIQPFITPDLHINGGSFSSNQQSFWSPQIDVLSTGEVVAIGEYTNVDVDGYPQLAMENSNSGMFIMKYHPDFGVYDVQNITEVGNSNISIPKMYIDKYDNIVLAANWVGNNEDVPEGESVIKILDSIIPMRYGTFVLSLNSNYEMNWLSLGTHSYVEDIAYSQSTGETFLATITKDNFSLGTGNIHMRCGIERQFDIEYDALPQNEYPWLNLYPNASFITKLDENGVPVSMKSIKMGDQNFVVDPRTRIASSACGDLAIFSSNRSDTIIDIEIDGNSYVNDSVYFFIQYSSCLSDDCSYLDAANEMEICAVNGTIDVQLDDYYNLNSTTYNLVSGGSTLVSNQTAQVVNGRFSFSTPIPNGVFDVIFISPNADTMTITVQSMTLNFGTIADDTMCVYGAPIQLGNNALPANGTYSGNGISGSVFIPSVAGVGSQVLTYSATDLNGCSGTIDQIIVVDACAGIDDLELNHFSIYPNPFGSELIVTATKLDQSAQIIIKDQLGRIVYKQQITELSSSINLKDLAVGNYFTEIVSGNILLHRELVVKI